MKNTLDFRVLTGSSDSKITGIRNENNQTWFDDTFFKNHQTYKKIFYKNDSWDNSWWENWTTWNKYGMVLKDVIMEKTSKHTDYLSSGLRRGFFVSQAFREVLESCNLPSHHFFEVTFNQSGKEVNNYWWFCYDMETGEHTIDFTKCEYDFRYHNSLGKLISNTNIKAYSEYMSIFYSTGAALKTTKLVFNKNFNTELDLWATQFLTNEIYISKRLYDRLILNNLNGFDTSYPIFQMDFLE